MRLSLGPPLLLSLGLLAAPACLRACDDPAPSARAGAPRPPGSEAPAPPDPLGPPSQAELPTTPGVVTVTNLDGQIEALESLHRQDPARLSHRQELIPLLSTRARFLGRVADAERAAALAEGLVHDAPDKPWAYVLRASTRSAWHLFPGALADLAEAEKRGARAAALAEERATVLEGRGDLDAALSIRRAAFEAAPDLTRAGSLGALLGQLGLRDEARSLFARATRDHRSVSAFPVAWLFLQEGLFWERSGEAARARAYFEAAHERLPAYGHAASHLAALVPPARGIELLEPIVAASDDPELELALAGRLRAAGRAAEADARAAHVGARYAALAERHPEAYAGHYAAFLLDEGKDPGRAFALARVDLGVRRTERAYELAMLAALAAGKRAEACAIGGEARSLPHAGEMVRGIADRACRGP